MCAHYSARSEGMARMINHAGLPEAEDVGLRAVKPGKFQNNLDEWSPLCLPRKYKTDKKQN